MTQSGKYDLIVVDPPWPLQKLTHKARPNQVGFDYKTMSLDDIAKVPVQNLASDKCWCFLWTTQKFLFDSKAILEGWGFKHLLTQVWEKTFGKSSGMPLFGFRWNAEFILVGHNHKIDMWPNSKLIPASFQAVNEGHSIKPQKFYDMVAPLGERRVDLFARTKRDGWDVWGDEVESDIDITLAN